MLPPGLHKIRFIFGKIKIITAKEEKIADFASGKITQKSFFVGHKIANAGGRVGEIGKEKISQRQQPKGIDESDFD